MLRIHPYICITFLKVFDISAASTQHFFPFLKILFFIYFFNQRINALQNFVVFYQISTRISHRDTYVPSFFFFICFFFNFFFISWRLITSQYCSGFCHTLIRISHGFTCIPHPDPPSHLPLRPIPLGLPSAPALSTCLMHPTWAGDLFHPR